MRCWRAKKLFSAYLDDELRSREVNSFREHLEGCPACRREVAELSALKESLGSVGYRLPAGFKRAVLSHSRLSDLVIERYRDRGGARLRRPNMRLILAAASVVLLAVGLGFFGLDDMTESTAFKDLGMPLADAREADEAPAPAEAELEREGIVEAVTEAVEENTGPEDYLSEHLAAAEVAQISTEELSRHVIADEALNSAADIPATEPASSARFSLVSTGAPIPDAIADLPPLPVDAAAADVDAEAVMEAGE